MSEKTGPQVTTGCLLTEAGTENYKIPASTQGNKET